MNSLVDLGKQFKTDKYNHGYLPVYEKEFYHLKDKPITILEIGIKKRATGVVGCESINMWRKYFSSARLIGLDIIDVTKVPQVNNVELYQCDCSDMSAIKKIMDKNKISPDIVIDDGGHTPELHQKSLSAIFPYMNSGGVYVIEDLQVCHVADRNDRFNVTKQNNTITYLENLNKNAKSIYLNDSQNNYIIKNVSSVKFEVNKKLAFLYKV